MFLSSFIYAIINKKHHNQGEELMIIITGASRGIGKAIAIRAAEFGRDLWLTGKDETRMAQTVAELKKVNSRITIRTSCFDLADKDSLLNFIKEVKQSNVFIEGLFNNAGFALDLAPIDQTLDDDIDAMIDVNVRALFILTRHISAIMRKQDRGHIINIGSTAAITAYRSAAVYCATKAAVKTFTDGIRLDLVDSNVKVTLIQPGIVETDFSLTRFKGDKTRADAVYSDIDALEAIDIADAVCFVFNTPKHMQVAEMTIMATNQGNGFTFHKQ